MLGVLLLLQGALFVALPVSGSDEAWGIFAALNPEVAADALGPASWWDAYDGLVAGPLAFAALEVPLLLVLGPSPWVHVLGTLAVALGTTLAGWLWLRREGGPTAAAVGAMLLAFPPPNTWYHQHQGAYHLAALLVLLLGMLLMRAEPGGWLRELLGWVCLFGSVALAAGTVGVAAPIGAVLWALRARRGRRAAAVALGLAALGALIGFAPVLYKALIHDPFGGLAAASEVAGRTKPFFVDAPGLFEIPGRLLQMFASDLPYGLHFGRHGIPGLDPLAAFGLVAAALGLLAVRPPRAWWPLAAAPVGAAAVGLLTGWWIFRAAPGDAPFPRDARHILAFTLVASLCAGLLAESSRGLARRAVMALAAVVALGSIATQVNARGDSRSLPFRLEGRFLQGFFAGPVLPDAAAAEAVCSLQPAPRRRDCLRGVAWAWGHRHSRRIFDGDPAVPGDVVASCSSLDELGPAVGLARGDLLEQCWFGLGFGLGDAATWRPEVAVQLCRDPRVPLPQNAVRLCIEGAGFSHAQNFWNASGVMRERTGRLAARDRADYAGGIGAALAIIGRETLWIAARCADQTPAGFADACLAGAERSSRYLLPPETR